uniref:GmrSD restriction endonuclease domain-containing protein n=1 Tax=Nonlabens sp. Ci31 TaxID=2608253 RepID=UPI001F0EA8C0|nr:DUF262 domain-containing protein [Nonlabens sp. Ci31]
MIPVYQRNYNWTNSECKELLNDVIAVEKHDRGTHFIGSIVFIHEGTYSTSEVKNALGLLRSNGTLKYFMIRVSSMFMA